MLVLIGASVFFLGLHFVIAGTRLRDALVARLGAKGFRRAFSLLAIVGLAAMVAGYSRAQRVTLWEADILPATVFFAGNLLAVALLVIGALTPSPNSILTERAFREGRLEVRGILRITRHPAMLGLGWWALMHLLANGDSASVVFFGALATLALLGPLSMDRKKLRLDGERYRRILEQTSYLPFAAWWGRNHSAGSLREVWAEIGWLQPALAILVFAALVVVHPWLAGVSIL